MKFNWGGMTFWSKGGEWSSGTTNLLSLYPSVYTEGTLQYHPYMQVIILSPFLLLPILISRFYLLLIFLSSGGSSSSLRLIKDQYTSHIQKI